MIAHQDQDAVAAATDACLAHGLRVLQLYQCGDEATHVARLLALMDPPQGAAIVDVGCGIGEVARRMAEQRPDLGFVLLNLSAYQLALCPPDMTAVHADLHAMPLHDACADVVMVNYTLGYADLATFFMEAHRVLKPGGILFIYDLSHRQPGQCTLMQQKFQYRVHALDDIHAIAWNGFHLQDLQFPTATRAHLAPLLDHEYRMALDELDAMVRPTAWRFMKET